MSGYRLTLALVLTSALAANLGARPNQNSGTQQQAQVVAPTVAAAPVVVGCPSGSCDG
jgi:hypothetical protein